MNSKRILTVAVSLSLLSGAAIGGGFERSSRSGQPFLLMFEDDSFVDLKVRHATFDHNGQQTRPAPGYPADDVIQDYTDVQGAVRYAFNDTTGCMLQWDEPFAFDTDYSNPFAFDQTYTKGSSSQFTAACDYEVVTQYGQWDFAAGLRYLKLDAEFASNTNHNNPAVAQNFPSDIAVSLDSSYELGYVLGVAFEIPSIALRTALIYQPGIDIDFDGSVVDVVGIRSTDARASVSMPDVINFNIESGVTPQMLMGFNVRHATWSDLDTITVTSSSPANPNISLQLFDADTTEYSLYGGYRINDSVSLGARIIYEDAFGTKSARSPDNGRQTVGFGAAFKVSEQLKITPSLAWSQVGGDTTRINPSNGAQYQFADSDVWSFGLGVRYTF
ncbi:outer membrane protein transport protein [Gammaproteobacteria bacterium]|nr:outer membrane protein transport protein [Gammaproteobacteria bacterium]